MKKHLIAAAVAAAVAVPAMAQVTVYGIIDQGYRDTDLSVDLSGGKSVNDTSSTVVGSAYTTQRLGFRGEEDLGGGLKASFNYEIGLGTNTAAAGGNDGNSDSGTSAMTETLRQANVGISGGFGSIRVGQMTTQADLAYGVGDVGSGNNFVGRIYGGSGIQLSNARSSRLIEYTTPRINGFTFAIQHGKGSQKTGDLGVSTSSSNKELGLGVRYSAGPLNVALGYAKETAESAAGVKTAEPKEFVIGANYNFGPATAFFIYQDGSNKGTIAISGGGETVSAAAPGVKYDSDALEIGVRIPSGAWTFQASMYNATKTWKLSGKGEFDQDGYQLAALYAMSKRTMLYGVIGSQDWDGKKGLNGVDVENDQFGFGVRHSF